MGLSRRPVTDSGMPPAPVIKDFNILEQRCLGFLPGAELCPMHQLGLERAKERFHGRMLEAVSNNPSITSHCVISMSLNVQLIESLLIYRGDGMWE